MFELIVAGISALYLAGNQGGNDSPGNQIMTAVMLSALAAFARRYF